mgnify:FL=1
MYSMYFGDERVPVVPEKITIKIKNQNKTLNLISGVEINTPRDAGLSEVSFDLLLPQVSYSFAPDSRSADYYLGLFEKLKTDRKPFQWIVNRQLPNGSPLFFTNLTVTLEDYQIIEDAGEGFDVKVRISLKQFRAYGTKKVTINESTSTASVTKSDRDSSTAPEVTSYTVKAGDCLWNIAKKYLGKGSRYTEIAELNKDKIKTPNLIFPGQVLTLPAR